MPLLTLEHCRRATVDIAAHGDNDVLPFDVDTRFIAECSEQLAALAFKVGATLERKTLKDCKASVRALDVFSERLLAPVGPSGFRVTTKIHPFWNIYLNALAVAIAELLEPHRSPRAHSYRFAPEGPSLFDQKHTWRTFRRATIGDCDPDSTTEIVVQTDISSFYEHVNHHRLENYIQDLLPPTANHSAQINVFLGKLAAGRSFGLPVGVQSARVLAEVLLGAVDRTLTAANLRWRRYVDDFVLVAPSREDSYRALGVLAHALADLGLSLNRSKTSFLSSKHYRAYVETQLGTEDAGARQLKDLDLHYDPYSDTPTADYDALQQIVQGLDLERVIAIELDKGQPDSFVVTQVARALVLLTPQEALAVCTSLLNPGNLHALRAKWSTVMRGVAQLRGASDHKGIHGDIDRLLDRLPTQSPHLLTIDTNVLHYLRAVRFRGTAERAQFALRIFASSQSPTVRRACIDCWRRWRDRDRFVSLRNDWATLSPSEQRMLWLAAPDFGDDGVNFQKQVGRTLDGLWRIGVQRKAPDAFAKLYVDWVTSVTHS